MKSALLKNLTCAAAAIAGSVFLSGAVSAQCACGSGGMSAPSASYVSPYRYRSAYRPGTTAAPSYGYRSGYASGNTGTMYRYRSGYQGGANMAPVMYPSTSVGSSYDGRPHTPFNHAFDIQRKRLRGW